MRIAIAVLLLAWAAFAAPASALPALADHGAATKALSAGSVDQVRNRYVYPRKQALRAKRRYNNWAYYPYWRPYQYHYWQYYYPYGGPLF